MVGIGHTLTRHTDRLSFVRAINNDLRGLGLKERMGWGRASGREGCVDSFRAVAVGKYINDTSFRASHVQWHYKNCNQSISICPLIFRDCKQNMPSSWFHTMAKSILIMKINEGEYVQLYSNIILLVAIYIILVQKLWACRHRSLFITPWKLWVLLGSESLLGLVLTSLVLNPNLNPFFSTYY